jgi:hypothetical protein
LGAFLPDFLHLLQATFDKRLALFVMKLGHDRCHQHSAILIFKQGVPRINAQPKSIHKAFSPVSSQHPAVRCFIEDWLKGTRLVVQQVDYFIIPSHDDTHDALRLFHVLELRLTALPDGWHPFAGHDQFRADGDSCKKPVKVRKLHAVTRRLIGHQKHIQFLDQFGSEVRCVYHDEVPMWLVRWLRTFL